MSKSWKIFPSCRKILCLLPMLIAFCDQRQLDAQTPSAADTHASSQPGFAAIDSIMQDAVANGRIPGGVVLIGHNGEVVYRKAFGWRSLEPARERMTVDTIFDLASLTKCIATTTAMMQLVEQGRVRLDDPVSAYLPGLRAERQSGYHCTRIDDPFLGIISRSRSKAALGRPRSRIPHGDGAEAFHSTGHALRL